MDETNKSLDDLVRDELGGEPSQEAKDYARQLYERYRIPADQAQESQAQDSQEQDQSEAEAAPTASEE